MTANFKDTTPVTFLVKKKVIAKLDLTNKIGGNIKKEEMQTISTIPTSFIRTVG